MCGKLTSSMVSGDLSLHSPGKTSGQAMGLRPTITNRSRRPFRIIFTPLFFSSCLSHLTHPAISKRTTPPTWQQEQCLSPDKPAASLSPFQLTSHACSQVLTKPSCLGIRFLLISSGFILQEIQLVGIQRKEPIST